MQGNTRAEGKSAEDAAVEYLLSQGYVIVTRNYQTRHGEIDCVAAAPDGVLVFVEVKSSRGPGYGHPFFRVNRSKQRQLMLMARIYLADHRTSQGRCSFDVIAVQGSKIEHLRNAIVA